MKKINLKPFHKKEIEKNKIIYVFIDGGNLWRIFKSNKKFLDYEKLKKYFLERYNPKELKIFYYDAYPENETREYDTEKKHKFFVYLKKSLGFKVVKKPLKQIKNHKDGVVFITEKGNMDVELTVDFVHNIDNFDIAFLFSGDCDFFSLIKYAWSKDKKVYTFSSKNSVSKELKTGSDGYFELIDIEEIWGKGLSHREKT